MLSMKYKLIIAFYSLAIIPLLIALSISYFFSSKEIKEREFNKLVAVRDLKVHELNDWLLDIESFLSIAAQSAQMHNYISTYKNKQAPDQLLLIDKLVSQTSNFHDVIIINNTLDRFFYSTNPLNEFHEYAYLFGDTAKEFRRAVFSPIYFHNYYHQPVMSVLVPVFSPNDSIMAYMCATIDLQNTLYKKLLNRTGMGKTGETIIVDKNKKAVSELRWQDDAPLKFNINAAPSRRALKRETGIIESADYRGVEVLAAFTYIEKTQWAFVSKQDLSEIYQPLKELTLVYLSIILCTVIAVFVVVVLLMKLFYVPINTLTEGANEVASGNYKVVFNETKYKDVAILSKALNKLVHTVEQKIEIDKGVSKIITTLFATENIRDFRNRLIETMLELTSSAMAGYFIFDTNKKVYHLYSSIGYPKNTNLMFDRDKLEGEIGLVISTQGIVYTKVSESNWNTPFKSTVTDLKPVEIVSIPIVYDGEVHAIISLASLTQYTQTQREFITQSQIQIKTILLKHISNLETKKFAEKLQVNNEILQKQSNKLKKQTADLTQQATELQTQNVELDMQRAQIEEANKLKSEFLSNMSHELRTPLNSVIALSKILLMQTQDKLDSNEYNYLHIIEKNGENLLNLINDILDLSKIEAGRMDIDVQNVSLKKLFNSIYERLKPIANQKNIAFNLNLPNDLPEIKSDYKKLVQIYQNIAGNALKFTSKGKIEIDVLFENTKLIAKFSDTGIGIPANAIQYIFDEFRQVDGTASKQYEGTGLGLSIAKRNAELLGGNISVSSVDGEGSVFTITLPVEIVQQKSESEPQKNKNKWIAVIDDEPQISRMVSEYLNDAGYKTVEINSVENILEQIKSIAPFAITLDLLMPQMDGFEIMRLLKTDIQTRNIPVIVVSVSKESSTAFALGATSYLTKPVDKEMLIGTINNLHLRQKQIMVVEDNKLESRQIVSLLKNSGFEIDIAHNGKECLQKLELYIPDLIILDLMMPEVDGFEVMRTLSLNKRYADIPLIISTSKDLSTNEKSQLKGNVLKVLSKNQISPIDSLIEIKNILENIENKEVDHFDNQTILVVEDNEAAITQLIHILKRSNYHVEVANGGKQAIEFLNNSTPNGVILDLMMPEIDGKQVLNHIRSKPQTIHLPVLILTAKQLSSAEKKELNDLNVDFFLFKGNVDKIELLTSVRDMLMKQHKSSIIDHNFVPKLSAPNFMYSTVNDDIIQKNKSKSAVLPLVLVVEDNADNLTTMKAILNNKYRIIEAYDGQAGWEKARELLPDIILLDISLPVLAGTKVVELLKDDSRTKHIPVIAVTAQAMKADRERILSYGCNDYISKPIDPILLISTVENWLSKNR